MFLLLVFGIINILLFIFPGWLRPFSNTIGYLFVKFTGGEEIIDKLFEKPNSNGEDKINSILSKILENKMLVINEITETNFDQFTDKMITAKVMNNDNDNITKLRDMIYRKNIIAESIWYILTGILVIAIVNNFFN